MEEQTRKCQQKRIQIKIVCLFVEWPIQYIVEEEEKEEEDTIQCLLR